MNIIDRLQKIDRRIIFIVVALSVALPLLVPFELPMIVSPPVKGFYDAIDKLEPNSVILLSCDYDPSTKPELYPMNLTMLRQVFSSPKNLKVIVICLRESAPPMAQDALDVVAKEYNKKYGVDYINLGYKAGADNVMVSLGQEVHSVFPKDYLGKRVSEFPIMKNVHNYNDIAIIACISPSSTPAFWVKQVGSRYNKKIIAGVTAVSGPEFYAYFQSKQMPGLIGGLRGAAEYEKLLNIPGSATAGMGAQTLAHIVIILFVIVGNVTYIISKRKKK